MALLFDIMLQLVSLCMLNEMSNICIRTCTPLDLLFLRLCQHIRPIATYLKSLFKKLEDQGRRDVRVFTSNNVWEESY